MQKRRVMAHGETDAAHSGIDIGRDDGRYAAVRVADVGGDGGDGGDGDDDDDDDAVPFLRRSRSTPLPYVSLAFLTTLYYLQGLSLGLCTGSIPFLLQEKTSLGDMALFSLASYPYSLKLGWSPFVDAVYSKRLGRRKSWILPMQIGIAVLLFASAGLAGDLVSEATAGAAAGSSAAGSSVASSSVTAFTALFLVVVTLTASQDIAVDGWAITMLPEEHSRYASTCQSVGITAGYFTSFTVFLGLQQGGYITLPGFMRLCAVAYLGVSALVLVWPERGSAAERASHSSPSSSSSSSAPSAPSPGSADEHENLTVASVYRDIAAIVSLPSVRRLALLMLVWKVPFMAFDAVLYFRLVRKGFRKGKIASLALVQFPFEILFSVLAGRWSRGDRPLRPVVLAYLTRLAVTVTGPILLASLPTLDPRAGDDFGPHVYAAVMAVSLTSSFSATVIFVSQGSFFNRVADPVVGGTYMTALNTISNFGGTWPKALTLWAVHALSESRCERPQGRPYLGAGDTGVVDDFPVTCDTGESLTACLNAGGTCHEISEGYYTVAVLLLLLGVAVAVVLPTVLGRLEKTKRRAWLVRKATSSDDGVGAIDIEMNAVKRSTRHGHSYNVSGGDDDSNDDGNDDDAWPSQSQTFDL